jgi:glycosyltransferase involved in cell wall biosynthesis
MRGTSEVTIGIPAYNASSFLEETVRSALEQTWPHKRILVSVDRSDDNTTELAQEMASKWGLHVMIQSQRIGWVANSNAVLRAAKSPYMMILPHDDLLLPNYIERCVQALQERPGAVVACSDISTFGDLSMHMRQLELLGPPAERVEKMVRDGFVAVAYRGVVDRQMLGERLIPNIAIGDFAADTLWLARMSIAGEVIRVPEVLYQKRMYRTSTHSQWKNLSRREERQRWLAHTAELETVVYEDAPQLRHDARIRRSFNDRACRRGAAFFERDAPIGGIAALFPMLAARFARWQRKLRYL